jgi:hypothetical protein
VLCGAPLFARSGPLVAPILLWLRQFFVSGAVRTKSIQGSVSVVQLGSLVDGTGATVQVTFVTFFVNAAPFTIGFCDDQIDLFPLDQTVLVDFNPGLVCANVIQVVIVF